MANPSTKVKQPINYPHTLRKGGVSLTVYRVRNSARGDVFMVNYFRAGVRKRDTFRDEAAALQHASATIEALAAGKGESLALGSAELEGYAIARKILEGLEDPPPLHVALEEWVAAKKALGDKPLMVAVKKYLHDLADESLKPILVADLVQEFIRAKQKDNLGERYIRDCRERLGRFGRDFQVEIADIKTGEINKWLRDLNQAPRTRNNFRDLVVSLFRYARSEGYLPKDRTVEAEHCVRANQKTGELIEIFSPQEMKRLLDAAGNEVLPYLALGAFAGIRTAEIVRLTWDCVRWEQKVIEIRAGMAKTSQRRLVPLSDNLEAWLRKVIQPSGPIVKLVRPEKTAGEIVCAATKTEELEPVVWKRNGLRHSYASYRLAIMQDAGKLALEMGNSPDMIFKHYRELVTLGDAQAWFAIMPGTD